MACSFYMPVRLVYGDGALAQLPGVVRSLGLARVLVVSDPVIAALPFYARALEELRAAGMHVLRFEECGIDARLAHIDTQADRCRLDRVDGLLCIGGGSVMCTGKGIAIVATNPPTFRNCAGVANFANKALPTIMVPTTAGSGSEVSQFTVVKDQDRHGKLVGGGPLSFPAAAILDPDVLESLPMRAAAVAAVDALTHALEAYFTEFATPLTDALALDAIRLQVGSMRRSICGRDRQARADNLLASAMANIACGNARLGLAHALSLPLEGLLDLTHGVGVGVLMPRVLAFNAVVAPERVRALAPAFGIDPAGRTPPDLADAVVEALLRLYDDVGFPRHFDDLQVPRGRMREMAEAAVKGLYGGPVPDVAGDHSLINSPNLRKATVAQAERIFAACFA